MKLHTNPNTHRQSATATIGPKIDDNLLILLLSTARSNVAMHNGVLFTPPSFLHHPINPCLLNGAAEPHITKATTTSTPQPTMATMMMTTMTKSLAPPMMLQPHSPVDRTIQHLTPAPPPLWSMWGHVTDNDGAFNDDNNATDNDDDTGDADNNVGR